MGRFRWWLMNFMRGRYGTDDLNRFLLMIWLVLLVLDLFTRWRWVDLLVLALLVVTYFRMFSRNINARYRENQKFLDMMGRFRSRSRRGGGSYGGYSAGGQYGRAGRPDFTVVKDKTHKILRCPGCGEKLRVPKGAGNILISCPHCHTKFNKKV